MLGIAGGADIVLLPEIPYRMETVIASIERRIEHHRSFTIIAIAEGAYDKNWADKKRKERAQLLKEGNFPSVSYYLADQIQRETGTGNPRCRSGSLSERRFAVSL